MSETERGGIGGTDIAAIAGVHPYKTGFDVYARIVEGLEFTPDEAASVRMDAGRFLEPWLLTRYMEAHDIDPSTVARNIEMADAEHSFLRGEADALAPGLVIEAKTVWSWRQYERWGDPGTDAMPIEYLMQVAWYCMLSDRDAAAVIVLIDGEVREYKYQRDRELEAALRDKAVQFWRDHIEPKVPPTMIGASPESVNVVYRKPKADARKALPVEASLLERWREASAIAAAANKAKDELAAQVKDAIRDAAGIETDGGAALWTPNADKDVTDWEAVARELGATPDLIGKHTTIKPGARVLRWKETKTKGNA